MGSNIKVDYCDRHNSHKAPRRLDIDDRECPGSFIRQHLQMIAQIVAENSAIIITAMYFILNRVRIFSIIVVKISGNIE